NRLLEQSQILEPQERFNPYRDFTQKHISELEKELTVLPDIQEPRQLQARVLALLKAGVSKPPTPEETLEILADALLLSPRVGESLTLDQLAPVEPALVRTIAGDNLTLFRRQAVLRARALMMAASYDRVDTVQRLWPRFVDLLQKSQ